MSEKKIYPEPLEALILVLASFFIFIILIFIYGIFSGAEKPVEMMERARFIYIFGGILFLVIPLLYSHLRGYPLREVFRLKPIPLSMVVLSVAVGIALTIVGDELDRLVQMIVPSPEWLEEMLLPLKANNNWELIQIITGAVVIAAISEEFLFRGFLQIALEKKGDITRAVLLTSIAWTLIHQNPYWAIQIFIVGVIIGFVAWRADSVFPAIIVHGIYNLIGVLIINVESPEAISLYEWRGHVNPLLLLTGLILLVVSIRKMNQLYQR